MNFIPSFRGTPYKESSLFMRDSVLGMEPASELPARLLQHKAQGGGGGGKQNETEGRWSRGKKSKDEGMSTTRLQLKGVIISQQAGG